jgi:hypothetical protein
MNRSELKQAALSATGQCLKEKGYIAMVDVFMVMGKLTKEDYERWRFRQVPYLERVIRMNLSKISEVLRAVRDNSRKGELKPSRTVYVSWGKGKRQPLRFSKSGQRVIEELYSTHYLKPRKPVAEAVTSDPRSEPLNVHDPKCVAARHEKALIFGTGQKV